MVIFRVYLLFFVVSTSGSLFFNHPAWADPVEKPLQLHLEEEDPEILPFKHYDAKDIVRECKKQAEQQGNQQKNLPFNEWYGNVNNCLKERILSEADILLQPAYATEFKRRFELFLGGISKVIDAIHYEHSHCPCDSDAVMDNLRTNHEILLGVLHVITMEINNYKYSENFPSPRYKKWFKDNYPGKGKQPDVTP